MNRTDIWMPLYIGDYLADTARLTTEQHGAYLLLLMDYWRSGRLPDDDSVLAQITKLTPDAWSNAKAMLKQFFSIEDGHWVHKRVEQEIELAKTNKEKNHRRATQAAQARWGNKDAESNAKSKPSSNATSNANSNAKAMLEECPSPSPSPIDKSIYSPSFEKFWLAYPKKEGKKKAFESWKHAKVDTGRLAVILEAIDKQKKSEKWTTENGRFIPMPATWINQARWEDEVGVVASAQVGNRFAGTYK